MGVGVISTISELDVCNDRLATVFRISFHYRFLLLTRREPLSKKEGKMVEFGRFVDSKYHSAVAN